MFVYTYIYKFYVCKVIGFVDWLDRGLIIYFICEKSLEMCICLVSSYEFDCPEVTLCGWQDIKIQLVLLPPLRFHISDDVGAAAAKATTTTKKRKEETEIPLRFELRLLAWVRSANHYTWSYLTTGGAVKFVSPSLLFILIGLPDYNL